jgi:chromosome segregation ATPase
MEENKITRPLEVIETEINFYKQQTATGIIEIGKRLNEAKEIVGHGGWGKWLEDKVDFSQVTANKFMRIADEFSNLKSPLNLGSEKLWLLLDIPSDQRDDFISDHDVESLTTRQLQEEIKKAKEELKKESDILLGQKEQEYIKQKTEIESKNKELEQQLNDEIDTKTTEIEKAKNIIVESKNKEIEKIKLDLQSKQTQYDLIKEREAILEEQLKQYEEKSESYLKLKEQIDNLTKEKDDIGRQIASATSLSGYIVEIEDFLKTKLAPIQYSRALMDMSHSPTVIKNVSNIVECVELWCAEIRTYLPKENNYIIIEREEN